jgi:hypothetical protein
MEEPEINSTVREARAKGNLTPQKAIKMMCLDCSGYIQKDVRECVIPDCPLFDFRLGKNPFRKKRVMTEEQREAAIARLAEARKT